MQPPRTMDTECPHPVLHWHQGLYQRAEGDGARQKSYPIQIQPMDGRQILPGHCHYGQLTQRGLMMAYNNGLRVGEYLNKTFALNSMHLHVKDFALRTTDVHRTKETLQGFVHGVLDNINTHSATQKQSPQDPMQPLQHMPTVAFFDAAVDTVLSETCNYGEYFERVYADPEWVKYNAEVYQPLEDKVRAALNDPAADLYNTYDCLKTSFCDHKPIPETLLSLHGEMEAALLNYWAYGFSWNRTEANQLFTGAFILLDLLPALTNSYSHRENALYHPHVNIYSAHDLGNMQNIMSLFQIDEGYRTWPQYQAMFHIELYNKPAEKQQFVRFLLNAAPVVPQFCKSNVSYKNLCPMQVVLDYLQTQTLPTPEQCPYISRYQIDKAVDGVVAEHSKKKDKMVQQILSTMQHTQQQYQHHHNNNAQRMAEQQLVDEGSPQALAREFTRWGAQQV